MRLSPFSRVTPLLVVSALVIVIALAACSSDSEHADSGNPVTPIPTLVTIDTPDPSDEADADPAVASGEEVFAANACVACHSTGENDVVGPGLAGIGERAGTRVAGQSADEYLNEAIKDPGAFIVDGFANAMPGTFGNLPEGEINDLITFLKSL
ncbi:MAG: c-type cytochrome [Chloroflexi bacterium]|nr:c-type cytochrome [Chloroflexota bacterium]MBT4513563.1 c-type cytochrome [Chloroflexota bacterium]MBT5319810.1 c-type cytochrome [Chloroflexota bacterium]